MMGDAWGWMVRGAMRMACRAMPLMGGQSRVTRWGFVRERFASGPEEAVVRLRNGARISVNLRDYNGRMLYLFGTPDRKVIRVCRALLREGDCFMDVGANYGAVGLLCRDAVGESGEVHLVEPQAGLCQRMAASVALNRMSGVRVHQMGLMDREDSLVLRRPATHTGKASFVEGRAGWDEVRVEVKSAGEFVRTAAGGRPCGVKLDVEGAEEVVVPQIVGMRGVRFVVFECNREAVRKPIWGAAMEAGMTMWGIVRSKLLVRVRRLEGAEEGRDYDDVVAAATEGTAGGCVSPEVLAGKLRWM